VRERTLLIERDNRKIPVARQAELLGIARSTVYYKPVVDEYNLKLVHLIDEKFSRRMREMLRREGYRVNRKRVQRLMRFMSIETIYPRSNLSRSHPGHKIYPYLLRNQEIGEVNQVWSTDITYIRMKQG